MALTVHMFLQLNWQLMGGNKWITAGKAREISVNFVIHALNLLWKWLYWNNALWIRLLPVSIGLAAHHRCRLIKMFLTTLCSRSGFMDRGIISSSCQQLRCCYLPLCVSCCCYMRHDCCPYLGSGELMHRPSRHRFHLFTGSRFPA